MNLLCVCVFLLYRVGVIVGEGAGFKYVFLVGGVMFIGLCRVVVVAVVVDVVVV